MRALPRVFMLIKRGAVKTSQSPVVSREMSGHPIDNHPDSSLMQCVNQELQILGFPVPAGRRIKSGDLITPRWIKRMLGERHEFHMRETHLFHVFNERPRQF